MLSVAWHVSDDLYRSKEESLFHHNPSTERKRSAITQESHKPIRMRPSARHLAWHSQTWFPDVHRLRHVSIRVDWQTNKIRGIMPTEVSTSEVNGYFYVMTVEKWWPLCRDKSRAVRVCPKIHVPFVLTQIIPLGVLAFFLFRVIFQNYWFQKSFRLTSYRTL